MQLQLRGSSSIREGARPGLILFKDARRVFWMATKSTTSVAVARNTRRYAISTIGRKRGQALLPWRQWNDWRAAIFWFTNQSFQLSRNFEETMADYYRQKRWPALALLGRKSLPAKCFLRSSLVSWVKILGLGSYLSSNFPARSTCLSVFGQKLGFTQGVSGRFDAADRPLALGKVSYQQENWSFRCGSDRLASLAQLTTD